MAEVVVLGTCETCGEELTKCANARCVAPYDHLSVVTVRINVSHKPGQHKRLEEHQVAFCERHAR